jgi:exodeoxyribonuclease VII large subunit
MKPAGVGELQAAFEKLKQKLSAEGLFDEVHKKAIPRFPKKIGIITGADSAAYRDILNIASRRYPLVELIVAPTRVQGEGAAKLIANSIKEFNKIDDVDILIVARGGGSLEDLWAFNEEIVARAIFDSRIPIISGVGHEIDFTIADFVSDLRAPTPSAAIELATPNREDILEALRNYSDRIEQTTLEKIEGSAEAIEAILHSYAFRNIENKVNTGIQTVDNLYSSMNKSIVQLHKNQAQHLKLLEKSIEGFNIEKTLKKGFTLIKQNGKFVGRSKEFSKSREFKIKFYDEEVEIKK